MDFELDARGRGRLIGLRKKPWRPEPGDALAEEWLAFGNAFLEMILKGQLGTFPSERLALGQSWRSEFQGLQKRMRYRLRCRFASSDEDAVTIKVSGTAKSLERILKNVDLGVGRAQGSARFSREGYLRESNLAVAFAISEKRGEASYEVAFATKLLE